MMLNLINDATITNMFERNYETKIRIEFNLKEMPFELELEKNDQGNYYPVAVRHRTRTRSSCMYCRKENKWGDYCEFLHANKHLVFEELLHMPAIRLQWLYLPYDIHYKKPKYPTLQHFFTWMKNRGSKK